MKKRWIIPKLSRFLLIIACCGYICIFLYGFISNKSVPGSEPMQSGHIKSISPGIKVDLVDSRQMLVDKCPLPNMFVDDSTLAKFFEEMPPLVCRGESWVTAKNGKFIIDSNAEQKHGKIRCDYNNYYRVDDYHINYTLTPDFKSGSPLKGDYFTGNCKAEDGEHLEQVISTIIPRDEVIKRCRQTKRPKDSLGMNVYMLGFDSLSRVSFQQQLKHTYKYLTENLHAAVMERYNIVGDGTPQAFLPILTGKEEEELPLTRTSARNSTYVDVYPMIWKDFEKAGYATLHHEDMAYLATFGHRMKGFLRPPTDHYSKYSYEFLTKYPIDVPKFGIAFHGMLTHDHVNKVQMADFDVVNHIKMLQQDGILNNTLLIVMADHGRRFAQFRATQQGQLEERLPFFSFVAPEWFRQKYSVAWNNLLYNRARLTTPFDIHATLMHLLNWREPTLAHLSHRSLSLFDKIPAERGCAEAGIAPHWCTCLIWQNVHLNDSIALLVAKTVIDTINNETLSERHLCAKLEFVKLETAKYQIQFRTSPGDALYEATIYYDARLEKKITVNLKDISHINKYGDKPHCIINKNYFLAKWCVCYDKI